MEIDHVDVMHGAQLADLINQWGKFYDFWRDGEYFYACHRSGGKTFQSASHMSVKHWVWADYGRRTAPQSMSY